MANKNSICCAVFLCLLSWSALSQAQNKFRSPFQLSDVQLTVESSRDQWINMFPDGDLPSFGFSSKAELMQAVPSAAIEVFNMYQSADGTTEMKPSGEFLIPLLSKGQAVAFLTVAFFDNRYQVVAAGEMNLAKDAAPFITNASSQVWIRHLNHNADFIGGRAQSEDNAMLFHPLFTAKRAGFSEAVSFSGMISVFNALHVQPE